MVSERRSGTIRDGFRTDQPPAESEGEDLKLEGRGKKGDISKRRVPEGTQVVDLE